MAFSQRQILLVILFPFSPISHLLRMSSSFLSSILFSSFLHLGYLDCSSQSYLIMIAPGSYTSWHLRVNYFLPLLETGKFYLHFVVSYFWERRSVWLFLYCWTRSQPYSLVRIWINFPWPGLHTISNQLKPGFREIIWYINQQCNKEPRNTFNTLCVCMYVVLLVALWHWKFAIRFQNSYICTCHLMAKWF